MKRIPRYTAPLFFLGCLLLGSLGLLLQPVVNADVPDRPHVAKLTVSGPIGPATTDYLTRSMARAADAGAQLIVIEMDTPGGLDAATRDIIKAILASPVPVATYVHPAGSRAASAGTYILYGSHIAAMTPSTTLGAATPIQMGGPDLPGQDPREQERERDRDRDRDRNADEDDEERAKDDTDDARDSAPLPGTAMERKVINDAVAFIRGLAYRHGRNADWAERAVREAVSLTAEEALEQNVVDIVAANIEDLLAQLDGREITTEAGAITLELAELPVTAYDPDWRNELLAIIANPQVASILLMIGIYGLILEGYNPGALVPGVVGIICLLLGLYALQMLPVNYAGVALIIVGGLLILAEALVPSFGILGVGGVAAIVIGSIMLVDRDVPGMEVSYEWIGGIAGVSAVIMLIILTMVGRSLRMPRIASDQAMVGLNGRVMQSLPSGGQVSISGEIWNVHSEQALTPGQTVKVVKQQGLTLYVEPIQPEESTS